MDWLGQFWTLAAQRIPSLTGQEANYLVGGIIVAAAVAVGRWGWRFVEQAACFVRSRQRTLNAFRRDYSRSGAPEGRGVWLTQPINKPPNFKQALSRPRVLSIANLKGGVGKTTLTANVGAYLAQEWGLRVLLLDLDFQGSLSSMALPSGEWVPQPGQNSLATKLISGDIPPHLVPSCAIRIPLPDGSRGSLSLFPAYYDLAQADNRLMVEWLLKCRPRRSRGVGETARRIIFGPGFVQADVRYTLAEILHSDAVGDAYDLVIIDCPPRLTTGEVQAFCASTHVLIPTILDGPSREAVVSICKQIDTFKSADICPQLNYIGVVGTMIRGNTTYAPQIAALQATLDENGINAGILVKSTFLPFTVEMARSADEGIGYLIMGDNARHQSVKGAIGELATYIGEQMGLSKPPNFQVPQRLGPIPGSA